MAQAEESARKYDLYSQEAKQNAYELFDRMRLEDPVYRQIGLDGQTPIWFVTRYEEIERVLTDDRHFVREGRHALPPEKWYQPTPLDEMMGSHMLNRDWEDHRRLRGLVSKAFTPGRVVELRPRIEAIADELLDRLAGSEAFDLLADFAFHLPTIVIAEMLGIPVEDREKFHHWSARVLAPALNDEELAQVREAQMAFAAYLQALFAARRQAPRGDLISALLQAEEDGDRLSEKELFSTVVLLIIAGHETTVNMIPNAMLALWRHPEQLARLRENPGLLPQAVDELLRYDGSVERVFNRWVAADTELGGEQLRRGEMVIAIIGAGNRDPEKFDRPNELDFERGKNPHLAFGKGPHYCLGAPLARLEIEVALAVLLRRLPDLRPAVPLAELRYRFLPGFRSLEGLPVRRG